MYGAGELGRSTLMLNGHLISCVVVHTVLAVRSRQAKCYGVSLIVLLIVIPRREI